MANVDFVQIQAGQGYSDSGVGHLLDLMKRGEGHNTVVGVAVAVAVGVVGVVEAAAAVVWRGWRGGGLKWMIQDREGRS